jgi:hypothetical protein
MGLLVTMNADPKQVDRDIERLGAALHRLDPRDPLEALVWVEYGRLRWHRYDGRRHPAPSARDRADVCAAVDALERASTVYCGLATAADEARYLGMLGDALRVRYAMRAGSTADLDLAVDYMAEALNLLDRPSPDWLYRAEELAELYLDRHLATGANDDLVLGLEAYHRLLATPGRDADRTAYAWSEIGFIYAIRYERYGRPADRDLAIDAFDTAWRYGATGASVASTYGRLIIDRTRSSGRHDDDMPSTVCEVARRPG